MRTIIVGDVHGCCNTLRALIEETEYTAGEDRLVFVGDLIDRGPHIRETVDYVMGLQDESKGLCTVLMGNHEQFVVDVDGERGECGLLWDYPRKYDQAAVEREYEYGGIWYWNGGDKSMRQLFSGGDYRKYLAWIKALPYVFRAEDGYSVTHAGALLGVEEDDDYTKVWNRALTLYRGPLVICGHTPLGAPTLYVRQLRKQYAYGRQYPLPPQGILDIDTGCVFGYQLTAMVIEGKQFRLLGKPNMEAG